MSVRILSGLARGFPLATPRQETTRPTSVLIKRKLFDWRQNLEGYSFVDLCAGSGAVGFEALSRGADFVLVNDSQRGAFLTLQENREQLIQKFKFAPEMIVVKSLDVKALIQKELSYQLPNTEDTIIYLDPPYAEHALYQDIITLLKTQGFKGELWVESDRLVGPSLELLTGAFRSVIKTVSQGDHFVVVGNLV